MDNMILIYAAIIAVVVIILLFNIVVVVGGRSIAMLERRWFGKNMQKGRVIAMKNEIGVQARTLGPGLHLLIRVRSQAGLRGLRGKVRWEGDLDETRQGRHVPGRHKTGA